MISDEMQNPCEYKEQFRNNGDILTKFDLAIDTITIANNFRLSTRQVESTFSLSGAYFGCLGHNGQALYCMLVRRIGKLFSLLQDAGLTGTK